MSGQAGMRGYLVQTIVCLLDALEELNWSTVTLEPNEASEKVDILWRYADGRTKAVQVKSSRKQIREGQVNAVAQELAGSWEADEYELSLIGPCAETVTKMGQTQDPKTGRTVSVPPPRIG
jgi:hypothetical protein